MLTPKDMLDIYHKMLLIRASELKMCELFKKGEIAGHMLPCLGQEAIPAALSKVYAPDDYLITAHRGGGHYMAKGCDFNALWAELYGRSTGVTKGRGGADTLDGHVLFCNDRECYCRAALGHRGRCRICRT
jgi:acetoin:2,6-dichlorophenolindophenol oxidoreductase subunit alpha